jgi:hypothetical protein
MQMRPRLILTLLLAIFVAAALATVARRTLQTGDSSPTPVLAAAIPAAAAAPAETPADVPAPHEVPVSAGAPPVQQTSLGADGVRPVSAVTADAVASTAAAPAPRAGVPAPRVRAAKKVVATYFHGDVRCATCRKIEAYSREAVAEGFGAELASGAVEFRSVNVDTPENRHYITDYNLVTRSVVVSEEVEGAIGRWAKLDNVWTLVGDRSACVGYVQDAVREYLETQ